jgi:hypothetical protein
MYLMSRVPGTYIKGGIRQVSVEAAGTVAGRRCPCCLIMLKLYWQLWATVTGQEAPGIPRKHSTQRQHLIGCFSAGGHCRTPTTGRCRYLISKVQVWPGRGPPYVGWSGSSAQSSPILEGVAARNPSGCLLHHCRIPVSGAGKVCAKPSWDTFGPSESVHAPGLREPLLSFRSCL